MPPIGCDAEQRRGAGLVWGTRPARLGRKTSQDAGTAEPAHGVRDVIQTGQGLGLMTPRTGSAVHASYATCCWTLYRPRRPGRRLGRPVIVVGLHDSMYFRILSAVSIRTCEPDLSRRRMPSSPHASWPNSDGDIPEIARNRSISSINCCLVLVMPQNYPICATDARGKFRTVQNHQKRVHISC